VDGELQTALLTLNGRQYKYFCFLKETKFHTRREQQANPPWFGDIYFVLYLIMHMHVENNVSSIETGFVYIFFLRRVVEQIVKSISFLKNRHDWARQEAKKLYLSVSFECDVPTTCTGYHQNPFTSFQLRPCVRIDTPPHYVSILCSWRNVCLPIQFLSP